MNINPYIKQQNTALGVQNPRSTEAYALIEIARRMEQMRSVDISDLDSRQKLVDVYHLNLKLWTIFQSELANPDNALPQDIKENMLQLANFIDMHTIEQMRNPTTKGLEVLININRQVGAGLMGDSGDAAAVEGAVPTPANTVQDKAPVAKPQQPQESITTVRQSPHQSPRQSTSRPTSTTPASKVPTSKLPASKVAGPSPSEPAPKDELTFKQTPTRRSPFNTNKAAEDKSSF